MRKIITKITLICMVSILSGCEWYMWRMNLDRIDLAQGQLPKLNHDPDIAGPDLNKNGIRDDMDAYIQQTFHQPEQRRAVQQYAYHSQAVLLVDKTEMIRVRQLNFEIARAISCIYDVFPVEDFVAANVSKSIGAMTANTKPRFREKLAFSQALDGTSMTMPSDDYCDK